MRIITTRTNTDDLVIRARTDAESLGQLYRQYYDRIFGFCVHRLFNKEVAEDITSTIFLHVARKISTFTGRSERDFRNWLYTIAVNQTNSYIRKLMRRNELFAEAAASRTADADDTNDADRLDWPKMYKAISRLGNTQQTVITLRFFENLGFDEIAGILSLKPATVRVILHRTLKSLRNHLQAIMDSEV